MTDEIVLSRELHLPMTAATQTFAAMGKRGSGKTYAIGRLVEEMLRVGIQVIILDAIGNWYGLRLKRDGQTPSDFKIPILGGHRGDVALLPDAGELVARTLVETGSSAVLDVSLFRKNQRKQFATDFAEELLHLKKTTSAKTRLFLVLEEAQLYIPQRTQKGEERMLGAFEDLVKLGRNYGIGAALISQRPQAVNKDVLNQTEVLMVFQMAGRHERDAVEEWISEKDIEDEALSLVEEIPSLDVGQAFVWSPAWLRIFIRTKILEKRSFDASATPTEDDVQAGTLKPLDLGALQEAMRTVEERAAEDDPKKLRARIVELEMAVSTAESLPEEEVMGLSRAAAMAKLERVDELEALTQELARDLDEAIRVDGANVEKLQERIHVLTSYVERARETLDFELDELVLETLAPASSRRAADAVSLARAETVLDQAGNRYRLERGIATKVGRGPALNREARQETRVSTRAFRQSLELPPSNGDGPKLKAGARRMLEVAAAFPDGISKRALSTYSGVIMGGTFSDYLSALRTSGLISETADGLVLVTGSGQARAGARRRPTTREILELWTPKLKAGARRMLEILVDLRGQDVEKRDLSAKAGIAQGGTFSDYLSSLRTKGLVEDAGARIRASELLWLRGVRAVK